VAQFSVLGSLMLMNTKTRFPSDIGTIFGCIVCIIILAHSPDWTTRFIHKLAGLFSDHGQIFYEISIIWILCLGGGRLIGYLFGRLITSILKRK
jgi:hypothetical protein